MLSVAAGMLEAASVTGFDCDESAIAVARENAIDQDVEVEFILGRVPQVPFSGKFDTVIMNPPFGTRREGMDWLFLQTALRHADVVYSLHKTSTRKFLLEKATREVECKADVVAEMKFDIPKSYKFHKKESVDVAVDLLRFEKS